MCPAAPNVTCSPTTVGPGRGLQLPAHLSAAELQLPACSAAAGLQFRACSAARGLQLFGVARAVSLQREALSPGRAGPAERGPQPAPPPAAAGPVQEVGAGSPLPLPSRAVSPPRRRYWPLTRRPLLCQGLGRRPAEQHGRIQGTGESCAGLPREPLTRSRCSARPGGECFSLRGKLPVPRVSAGTAVCTVSCWEFLLKGTLWFLIIYFHFTLQLSKVP